MPPNFAAAADTARQDAAADRAARIHRAAALSNLVDGIDASWQAERAARAVRECPSLADLDIVVLAQAFAEAIAREGMHLEDRRDLVDALQTVAECLLAASDAEAREDDGTDPDAWQDERREREIFGAAA